MSLTHDGFAFFSHDHGLVTAETDFEMEVITGQFMGVLGESHLIDEPKGRLLGCDITFTDYSDYSDLEDDMLTLASKAGRLTGTLTQTIGSDSTTFAKCTFLGLTQSPRGAFFDGSGVHGWTLFARLHWRQRNRS